MSAALPNDNDNGSTESTELSDQLKNQLEKSGEIQTVGVLKIVNEQTNVPQISSRVPDLFSSGGTVRVDRSNGNCIGIKRMSSLGQTGYPEIIATHVYIYFEHFFELQKLLHDMIKEETILPGSTKRWFKYVKCHWEFDMYERQRVHKDIYSKNCSLCRSYVDKLDNKAIWWFNAENDKFIRMNFKNFYGNDITFECCFMWIKIVGTIEVELQVEDAAEATSIRRSRQSSRKEIHISTDMKDHKPIIVTNRSRYFITTTHLLKSLHRGHPFFFDTTFKLMRKPVTVFGGDRNGRFNPMGLAVTNDEQIEDFEFIFQSIKGNIIDWKPEALYCIATSAIRTAATNVFGEQTDIITSTEYVKKSVYDQFRNYCINENDRLEMLTELNSIGVSNNTFNVEVFLLKWEKYAEFVQYFKTKWVIENPSWRTSSTTNDLQALILSMKGLDTVEMLMQRVTLWSNNN